MLKPDGYDKIFHWKTRWSGNEVSKEMVSKDMIKVMLVCCFFLCYIKIDVATFSIFNIVEKYDYKDLKFEETL